MGVHAQAMPMSVLDDGLGHLEWNFLAMTERIIYPDLDDIHFLRCQCVHVLGDLSRVFEIVGNRRHASHSAFEREALSGREDARVSRPASSLFIADAEDQILI